MLDSLYIGATGMHAQQTSIDVIANNLANVNTAGFKRNRIDFEDLLYRNISAATPATQAATANGSAGLGTAIMATGKIFTDGDLKKTDQPLDVAIKGQGFFELNRPDGSSVYTRSGAFQVNADGMIVNQDGFVISGSLQVPPDTTSVKIQPDGRVFAVTRAEPKPSLIGQIELATFVNASGLEPLGDNLYVATSRSGEALRAVPGEGGSGTLAQGFQEASNVKLIDEMINLVIAQRAYEINAKVVQASDEMLSITNGLFR
jgi:flagellar basal-body rod protein FlgG